MNKTLHRIIHTLFLVKNIFLLTIYDVNLKPLKI
jgi:hypothetical protein